MRILRLSSLAIVMACAACGVSPTAPSGPLRPTAVTGFDAAFATASTGGDARVQVVDWNELSGGRAPITLFNGPVFASSDPLDGDPLAPSLAVPEINGNSVTLRWTAEAFGCCELPSNYILQYGFVPAFTGDPSRNLLMRGTVVTIPNVPAGITFWVRVLAFYELQGRMIGPSNERPITVGEAPVPPPPPPPPCAPPAKPTLTHQVTGTSVFLAWTRETADDRYTIDANGQIVASDLTAATVTAPAPPGTHSVRVKTTTVCGESPWSDPVTFTIAAPPPPPPPPPPSGPLVMVSWRTQVWIQAVNFGYRTTGTLDITLNRPVTGSYRGELNTYPFISQRRTFSNASELHFDLDHTSSGCPALKYSFPAVLYDASERVVASLRGQLTGTGCAFNDLSVLGMAIGASGIGTP